MILEEQVQTLQKFQTNMASASFLIFVFAFLFIENFIKMFFLLYQFMFFVL